MNIIKTTLSLISLTPFLLGCSPSIVSSDSDNIVPTVNGERPRVIVMTDGEVDDRCSMVHFLLCSNDFDVEAIIEANSQFQKHGWSSIHWLSDEIDDYAKVYPNLIKHDPMYPSPEYLKSVCFVGDEDESHLVNKNASTVLPGEEPLIDPSQWPDTPGSDRIVEVLLEDNPNTVYFQAWGGGNTAAKAFDKIKSEYPDKYEQAMKKVVMYNIWYQDGAGTYIERNHPLATMLISYGFSGTWDYGSMKYTDGFVKELLHSGHGDLAKRYTQDKLSEGDSPSFFHFINNGLRSYEHPTYGGFGGQFHRYEGFDNVYVDNGKGSYSRWIEYVNRDFEARLKWCVADDYSKANHHPVVKVLSGEDITVHSSDSVKIEVEVTDDGILDMDALWARYSPVVQIDRESFVASAAKYLSRPSVSFWQYEEAGTYDGYVTLKPQGNSVSFVAPKVDRPSTVHVIVEASDQGNPGLTSFKRVIVNVLP